MSRRIVSVFLYVALRQIATPYTRGSFADAEVNADHDFGLAEVFSQSFEIATDGRAFFENIGVTEANRYLAGSMLGSKLFPTAMITRPQLGSQP